MTRKQVKSFSTGAIVIGLVLLPGLASFIQQQLLQKKMMKLDLTQARWRRLRVRREVWISRMRGYTRLSFDTLKSWTYIEGKTPLPDSSRSWDGKENRDDRLHDAVERSEEYH